MESFSTRTERAGLNMTDAQKKFVDALRELLASDPLTSRWLMPLDPLLSPTFQSRFLLSLEGVSRYLVIDRTFDNGEAWLTPSEFRDRSRMRVEQLRTYLCHDLVADKPTGHGFSFDS